jgi:four helix bundle protein
MSQLITSFRDLRAYQQMFDLQQAIFQMSKLFPPEERYSLTDQVRRSSRSVGGNIAEAWAKRRYPAHFISKLTDADGELQETSHWLATALACEIPWQLCAWRIAIARGRGRRKTWQNDFDAREIHVAVTKDFRPLPSGF